MKRMTRVRLHTLAAVSFGIASGVVGLQTAAQAQAGCESRPGAQLHHYLPANNETVHWGYFSKGRTPQVFAHSGDFVTLETLTHHANDDASLMVTGDPGAESVFKWEPNDKGVDRRGAGPMDASVYGRGAGEGFGVHVLTGPVFVCGAEPGDVLEVRILDMYPRPSANPEHKGKTFGSNAAAWWGFHYNDMIEEPKPREVITIYEIDSTGERDWAKAVYNYRWVPQTDPNGVRHEMIDYPGVPVDHSTITKNTGVLEGVRIPIRPHFGTMGVAPAEADFVDSIPPGYFGGNIDNWRIGKGGTMYYPVAVPGALLSAGDPHAAQGDSELAGTAIETSLTGVVQVILHKQGDLAGTYLEELDYPLLETDTEWVVHGFSYANYLKELGDSAQSDIYSKSSIDNAMRDAFRKMRHFLMTAKGLSEDEAISLMSVAADFGVTQVVDGNWGVHGIVQKRVFAGQ
ncbi:acetamidase/formamidase family protein [Pelagibius sp. 7325]|uniref:acetamidase/formamidase family protein n=1 Tax=Pelagibius sp. 7325 TaxID=3131994 RepID=UPI0030EF5FFD